MILFRKDIAADLDKIFRTCLDAYFYIESILALLNFSFELSIVVHLTTQIAAELLRDKLQQFLSLGNGTVQLLRVNRSHNEQVMQKEAI